MCACAFMRVEVPEDGIDRLISIGIKARLLRHSFLIDSKILRLIDITCTSMCVIKLLIIVIILKNV